MRAFLVLTLAALSSCKCSPNSRPDERSAVDGCAASLSGIWHHGDDPSYRYDVVDRGASVVVRPFRSPAGSSAPAELAIELERRPFQLVGVTRQAGVFSFVDAGTKECTVEFITRITSCEEKRLSLEVEQSGAIGPDCRRTPGAKRDFAKHEWVRE